MDFVTFQKNFSQTQQKFFRHPLPCATVKLFGPIVARRAFDKYECIICSGDVY
jgi:hypothetical protein